MLAQRGIAPEPILARHVPLLCYHRRNVVAAGDR